jgi:hypothetical protein
MGRRPKIQLVAYTGDVDVQFGGYSVTEYVGFPSDGGWEFVEEGSDLEAKDVGQCTVSLTEYENEEGMNPSTAGNDDLDLVITITNGYPGYKCEVQFEVKNTGSIPVMGPTYVDPPSPYTDGYILVEHNINTGTCVQLHPGDTQTFEINVTVLQTAEEQTEYTVQIYLRYDQWNEAECGGGMPQARKDFTTTGGTPLEYLDGYRMIQIVVSGDNKITSPDHVVMVAAFYLPTAYTATSATPLVILDDLPENWSADPGASSWDSVVKVCSSTTFPSGFPNYQFSDPCNGWGTQVYPDSHSYSGGSGGVLTVTFTSGTYRPGWLIMFIKAQYDLQGAPLPVGYFTPYTSTDGDDYCIKDFENYAEIRFGDEVLTVSATLRGVGSPPSAVQPPSCWR